MTPTEQDQIEGARVRERRVWLRLRPIDVGLSVPELVRLEMGERPAEGWELWRSRLLERLEAHVDPERHWHTQIAGPWTAAEWRDAWLTRCAVEAL